MTLALTAETPTASTVPKPFGKPSGPGLWHVKGMQLPAYIQHVAHHMLSSGAAGNVSEAIQMAVGIVRKWSKGIPVGGETKVGRRPGHPGKIHPDVQAAAKKAMAEWDQKRAQAHVHASEHSMRYDPFGNAVDLAGVAPTFSGLPGYGDVRSARQEHVHREPGGPTTGGMKPAGQMSSQELRNHLKGAHAKNVRGMSNAQCVAMHNSLHKGSTTHVRAMSRPTPPPQNTAATTKTQKPYVAPAAARTAVQARRAIRYIPSGGNLSAEYDAWGNVIELAVVPHPTAAVRKAALKRGEALPHASGSPGKARFPLTNRTLAGRAVKMVQLAKGDKTAIRRYIMRVLRSKGWADLIPDNWNADGTTSSSN